MKWPIAEGGDFSVLISERRVKDDQTECSVGLQQHVIINVMCDRLTYCFANGLLFLCVAGGSQYASDEECCQVEDVCACELTCLLTFN